MTLRFTLSCDPGQTGALAFLADGAFAHFADMPLIERKAGGFHVDGAGLAKAIRAVRATEPGADVFAMIEQVSAGGPRMKGAVQGVTSSFRFGEAYGCVRGVLGAMGIPFATVPPASWKRALGLTGEDKDAARLLAIRLFPAAAPFLQRKKDVGRADALLIAHFAYLREKHALPSAERAKALYNKFARGAPAQLDLGGVTVDDEPALPREPF